MNRLVMLISGSACLLFLIIFGLLFATFVELTGLVPSPVPDVGASIALAEFEYYLDFIDGRIRALKSLELWDENCQCFRPGWEYLDFSKHYGDINASDGNFSNLGADNAYLGNTCFGGNIALGDNNILFGGGDNEISGLPLDFTAGAGGSIRLHIGVGGDIYMAGTFTNDGDLVILNDSYLGTGNDYVEVGGDLNVTRDISVSGDANFASLETDKGYLTDLMVEGDFNFTSVERHWIIDPARFQVPATNYPANGSEGIFKTLDFDDDTNELAYATEHYPYRAELNASVGVEANWLHDTSDNGGVEWCIEFIAVGAGDTVDGTETAICQASAGNHAENLLVSTTFAAGIPTTGWSSDDDIGIRFYRGASSANDTLAEDAKLINLHFHFLQNKLGKAT